MANETDLNDITNIGMAESSHTHIAHNIHKKTSKEDNDSMNHESKFNSCEGSERQSAVWTIENTLLLLKLYEAKLEILETPKKKTRIWIAIADNLKEHDIEVSPDQVRWKINALAKKYKQCINTGEYEKFRFFKEMDNIYSQFNVECTDFSIVHGERLERKRHNVCKIPISLSTRSLPESKSLIEMRKVRLAKRIEADRSQRKINIEKQWLEYLRRQEEQKNWRDEIFERNLKLREEELQLRQQELQMKEALELKKIEIIERDHEEIIQIEREKCELLKRIFSQQIMNYNLSN